MLKNIEKISASVEIPEYEWEKIKSKLFIRTLKKGEFLIREGETPLNIAFIKEGILRYYFFDKNCTERTIAFRRPGTFVSSYTSFLENKKSKISIQALVDSTLVCMTIVDYEDMVRSSDFWKYFAWKQGMFTIIEKENREIEILSHDAEKKYLNFTKEFPALEDQIQHYHIASYLGISNVTLSRIRKKVKK